jgi:hypothetical protein
MPLANTAQFISGLIANDKINFTTKAEAAAAFARVFSTYFGNVSTPPLLILPPLFLNPTVNPLQVKLLTEGLIGAFSAKDPASVSLGIQTAVLAYLTPASIMFGPTAGAVASPTPLAATLVPAMSVVNPDSVSSKTTLATIISTWLQTVTVVMGSTAVPLV